MTWRDWVPPVFWKASAVTRAMTFLVMPRQAVWTPKNYEQLAREGYQANVTVYACVNEVARALGGLNWLVYERRRGGTLMELDEHPLLALLARPNPFEGGAFFLGKVAGYLMLSGNSYIEAVAPNRRDAAPRELFALRPDRMRVLPDLVERVAGYQWEAGGQRVTFEAGAVLHAKLFHPTHDWYGLSPLEAAARSVDVDNESLQSNMSLLQNGLRPSGAMVVPGQLADDQYKRLKAELTQEYGGAVRTGLPMLLEGGADWKAMGLAPKDMDFLNGRKMTQLDICRAYGVPPELVNLKEGTFENRKEARKALYTETVLPLADQLRDDLNNWLTPRFGDRLALDYDRDAIEALQEDRKQLWDRIDKANELTINERRLAKGYDDIGPAGEVVLVPVGMIPLEQAGQTGPGFDALPGEEPDAGTDAIEEDAAGDDEKTARREQKAAREALWTQQALAMLPLERRYHAALRRFFAAQRDGVLARLARLQRLEAGVVLTTKDVEEILFEIDQETGRLREVSRPHFDAALRAGGHAVEIELGGAGTFSPEAPAPQQRLTSALEKLTSVVTRIRNYLRAVIDAALNDPAGVKPIREIAEELRAVYRTLSEGRARTIARTETARAFNDGRWAAFEQFGVEEIEWLSAKDEAVRTEPFNHAIDGERRRMGEPFSNGLRYPGDPAGAAANIINCRCVVIPVTR